MTHVQLGGLSMQVSQNLLTASSIGKLAPELKPLRVYRLGFSACFDSQGKYRDSNWDYQSTLRKSIEAFLRL